MAERICDGRSVGELIAEIDRLRMEIILSDDFGSYDTTVVASHMLLSGLAQIESGLQQLKAAEIFRAREYAGNF
jgi:hypothetical protein